MFYTNLSRIKSTGNMDKELAVLRIPIIAHEDKYLLPGSHE